MSGVNYEALPDQFRPGLQRWIEHGIQPGHFLTAVLEDKLSDAIGRADDSALAALPELVRWLHWEAPSLCHGSPERVRAWRESHEAQRMMGIAPSQHYKKLMASFPQSPPLYEFPAPDTETPADLTYLNESENEVDDDDNDANARGR